VLVVLAALHAAKFLDRAPLRSSIVGAIYGAVSGLGLILVPPSAASIRAAVLKEYPTMSPSMVQLAVRQATSPTMHVIEAVVTVVVMWLLAMLIGWIASLFVKKPGQANSV
jgi:hypothetical protein